MSFKHMAWALQSKIGDPLAKLLLIALADRTDKETNQCWPSLARLAADTEMSDATIKRKLNYLEERGYLTRTQRDQKSTLYTLAHTEPSDWLTQSLGVAHTEPGGRLTVSHEPISNNLSSETIYNVHFEEWWSEYPKKKGKGQARNAYKGALKKATQEELLSAVRLFAEATKNTDQQFIPHASTWLNGERWLDDDLQSNGGWGNLDDL